MLIVVVRTEGRSQSKPFRLFLRNGLKYLYSRPSPLPKLTLSHVIRGYSPKTADGGVIAKKSYERTRSKRAFCPAREIARSVSPRKSQSRLTHSTMYARIG